MLGSAEEAQFIRDWHRKRTAEGGYDRWSDAPPEGWTRLGSGCYRIAFLAPSGVAYKVQHTETSFQSNHGEANTLRRYFLTKMPKGCRLPRWKLYEFDEGSGIMAMERFTKLLRDYGRYDAVGSKYWEAQRRLTDLMWDVYDFHGANLAVDVENDLLVPIDLGG